MVTHTKLEVLKFQNLKTLKNSETLLRSLEFVIHQNLEHDVITVSNLVENWSSSTQISYSCRDVATGVVQICSKEGWVRVIWINDKIITSIKPKGRKQYICCHLQYQILKVQNRINHDEYWYQEKTVYSGISM